MRVEYTQESYDYVKKLAFPYAYGNTQSELYDRMVSAGLEGLISAVNTYREGMGVKFSTYAYTLIKNRLENERNRTARHDIGVRQDDYDFSKYDGTLDCIRDGRMEDALRGVILKAVKGNERNALIVELHIGIDDEPVELKDLAKRFSLSHESVRLIYTKAIESIRADKAAKRLLYSYIG
jgi:RNA polymerase sigma factor (sigma-70 family)